MEKESFSGQTVKHMLVIGWKAISTGKDFG